DPKELEMYREAERSRFEKAEQDFKGRLHAAKDYRDIQGDRTSAHTSDKTSMDRSLAFAMALKKVGGDPRYLFDLNASWVTGPLAKDDLRDMEIDTIADWIAKGSCRRGQYTKDDVTSPNEKFVKAYEEADFKIIEEIGLDRMKETDQWKKMTPCAQKGVLERFQQYRSRRGLSTEGITVRTSKNRNRGKKKKSQGGQQQVDDEETEVKPPTGKTGSDFDYHQGESCIWRFSGTCSEFKDKFNKALMDDDIVDAGFGALRSCLCHPIGCNWSRNRNGRGVVWRTPPGRDMGFVSPLERIRIEGLERGEGQDVASLLDVVFDLPDPALYRTLPSSEMADDGDVLAGIMDDVSARNELQAYRDELDSSDGEDEDDFPAASPAGRDEGSFNSGGLQTLSEDGENLPESKETF
ncbi:hypothetical protein FOZ62_030468, partial [Perkinsus olseni]